MGAEAYGLVGFFIMLQFWFNLLDVGLTPTLARETARYQGGSAEAFSYLCFVRSLEVIFFVLALVGGVALFCASNYISHNWLKVVALSMDEVVTSICLMSAIIALRWICGLYRAIISGAEQFVWLSCYNSVIATLRFLVVLLVFKYVGVTPIYFFIYQLLVAIVELFWLMRRSYRILPKVANVNLGSWSWEPLRSVLNFSFAAAFTSSSWILLTQVDKLILSKNLLLSDYAYFTLAVLVASGVMIISGPVGTALMPRLTKLEAEGNKLELIQLYRDGTQVVSIISSAACVTLYFYAEPLLQAWTGDSFAAQEAAPILVLYSIGNAIVSVASFPYILQYAKGDLKLHVIANIFMIALLVPLDLWISVQYGGVGTGWVWLILNLVYFAIWVPIINNKFLPGLNTKWYFEDTLNIFLFSFIVGYFLYLIFPHSEERLYEFIIILIYGFLLLIINGIASSFVRRKIKLLLGGLNSY